MKANILYILHLPPPVHGAAMMGKYIHESKLINNQFNCHYINLTTATELGDIGKINFKKIKNIIDLLIKVRNIVKDIKPQLVYITPNSKGVAFYKDFLVVQMLKFMNCKIVAHYHNKGVSEQQHKKINNLFYKIFFKNIKVILLAESLYSDIMKYVNRNDVYICPNGIPENNKEIYIHKSEKTTRLLFLSNLLIDKGIYILLDACKILKEEGNNFICNFVGGESAEMNSLLFQKEIKKRHLENNVYYLGKKYNKEKEILFLNSDIFILPTNNDCFPLVLLEAMQHKIPCISTFIGGIPDIITDKETGYILSKNEPRELANKIKILSSNEILRSKMGENAFNKFKSNYTLYKFENNLTNILKELV